MMKIQNCLKKYIVLIFLLCVAPWGIASPTNHKPNQALRENRQDQRITSPFTEISLSDNNENKREMLYQAGSAMLLKIMSSDFYGEKVHKSKAQELLESTSSSGTDENSQPKYNQEVKIRPKDSAEEIHSTSQERLNQLPKYILWQIVFNPSHQPAHREKALAFLKYALHDSTIVPDHNPKIAEQALFRAIEANDPISIEALRLLNITLVSPKYKKPVAGKLKKAFENGDLNQIQLLMQAGVCLSAPSAYAPTFFNLLETGIDRQNNTPEYLENPCLLASSDLNTLEQAFADLDIQGIKQAMQHGATISDTSPCFHQTMALLELGIQHQQSSDSISSYPIPIEDLINVNNEETELLSPAFEHKQTLSDCIHVDTDINLSQPIHVNDKMPPRKNWITRLRSMIGTFLFNWQGGKHNQKTKVK